MDMGPGGNIIFMHSCFKLCVSNSGFTLPVAKIATKLLYDLVCGLTKILLN